MIKYEHARVLQVIPGGICMGLKPGLMNGGGGGGMPGGKEGGGMLMLAGKPGGGTELMPSIGGT